MLVSASGNLDIFREVPTTYRWYMRSSYFEEVGIQPVCKLTAKTRYDT
jgi:hypothetical protein